MSNDNYKRKRCEHFVGAVSEYTAASAFLKNGFQVYWPSMHQDSVDFVAYKDGSFKRVQVKTATWTKSGKYKYLPCRTRLTKKYQDINPSELYDLLVVVAPDDRLWVIPAESIVSSNLCLDGTGPSDNRRKEWLKFQQVP